jgi:hypothetical protein
MPTFTTLEPIALTVRFASGSLIIDGSQRDTTTVDVRPGNPSSSADVEHAAATVVEQRGDQIVVIAPDSGGWFARTPKLDIQVFVPRGSMATIDAKSASLELTGDLGGTVVTSASGDVRAAHVVELSARTASGDVWCHRVDGNAKVTTASGDIWIEAIGGRAELGSASGDVTASRVGGDVEVRTASGDVSLGTVDGSMSARTASGDVGVASVWRGNIAVESASGDVSIGIAEGTTAWLDVQSLTGDVSSTLDAADAPDGDTGTVSVRAHTRTGDVVIRRAPPRSQPEADHTTTDSWEGTS